MNNFKVNIILILALLCFAIESLAQKQIMLTTSGKASKDSEILSKYSYKKSFTDSVSMVAEIEALLLKLHSDGFITASVDSIKKDSNKVNAVFFVGNHYKWVRLSGGNIEKTLLMESGWRGSKFAHKPVKLEKYLTLSSKLLTICENTGYPFASLHLDSIRFSDSTLSAALNLKNNTQIIIDSIVVKGKLRLSNKFLFHYLSLNPGNVYNESLISLIPVRIKELQFAREIKPFHVVFFKDKAKLILYLDKKKSNRFDGILGIAPNNQTTGKLMLTGELNLELENSFSKAEQLSLKWRKLQQTSQDLKLNIIYPYFFNLPFGIDGKFKLYKKDTIYLTVSGNYGLRYLFSGKDYFKAFFENSSSILLSAQAFKNATKLPDFADISSNLYGLEIRKTKLDYIYNPRKGYDIVGSVAAGNRKIKKNSIFNDTLYNNLKLNTVQYKTEFEAAFFQPITPNTLIKLGCMGAAVFSDKLYENELFLIGGLKTIRGFDEEAIAVSQYIMPYIEYRFIFEENSNFFLFFNQALYRKEVGESLIEDTPYGFGAGVNFETKAGIFTLSYALGKQFSNPIDFKNAKIHFGIVSYF